MTQKTGRRLRWLMRKILIFLASIMLLFIIAISVIRLPVVQQWITDRVTAYITKKTGAHCSIDRLLLTFRGRLLLEGLYLEDQGGDTLVYSGSLVAGISVRPLLRKNLLLDYFKSDGLTINVSREVGQDFNYQFIVDAFAKDNRRSQKPPRSAAQLWLIALPDIALHHFTMQYFDDYDGIDIQLALKHFMVDIPAFTLGTQHMRVKTIACAGISVRIEQWQGILPDTDHRKISADFTEEDHIGAMILDRFSIDDIALEYRHRDDDTFLHCTLDTHVSEGITLHRDPAKPEYFQLAIARIVQAGVDAHLSLSSGPKYEPVYAIDTDASGTHDIIQVQWPQWEITLGNASVFDHHLRLTDPAIAATPGVFNTGDLDLFVDSLILSDMILRDEALKMDLKNVRLHDHSGLQVRLAFLLDAGKHSLRLEHMAAQSVRSDLRGEVFLTYDSIGQFFSDFTSIGFSIDFPVVSIAPEEILVINPGLAMDTVFGPLLVHRLAFSTKASGTLAAMRIERLDGTWADHTRFGMHGTVHSVTDPRNLSYFLHDVHLYSPIENFKLLIPEDTSYTLPAYIDVKGDVSGTLHRIQSHFTLIIPEGLISGVLDFDHRNDTVRYTGDLHIEAFNAANYTDSAGPELISGFLHFKGMGLDPDEIHANFESHLSTLIYKGVDYGKLQLAGSIEQRNILMDATIDNEHLALTLALKALLDSTIISFQADIHLTHMDAQALGYLDEELQLSSLISVEGNRQKDGLVLNFKMDDLRVFSDGTEYFLDSLAGKLVSQPELTEADLWSSFANVYLTANAPPGVIVDGVMQHINSYFGPDTLANTMQTGLEATLFVHIRETQFLKNIVLPGLESIDDASLVLRFNQQAKSVDAEWTISSLIFRNITIAESTGRLNTSQDSLHFYVTADRISSGIIDIRTTRITGALSGQRLLANLDLQDSSAMQLVLMDIDLQKLQDTFMLKIRPEQLIFNDQSWTIHDQNTIIYAPEFLSISDFELSRDHHRFRLSAHDAGKTDYLHVDFNQISLEGLVAFLNPEEAVASGMINGTVTIDHMFDEPVLVADLTIEGFVARQIELGDLVMKIDNSRPKVYDADISLEGTGINVHINANYNLTNPDAAQYQITAKLNRLDFSILEPIGDDMIRDHEGIISGQVEAKNTGSGLIYTGYLDLQGIGFVVKETGSGYRIPSDQIKFSNKDIVFDHLQILDDQGNPTILNGTIFIEDITDPAFALNISSRNFKLLESTRADNDLIYGTAILDMDLDLKGTAGKPVIQANIRVKNGSMVTLVLPEKEIDIVDRQGVVVFESRSEGVVIAPDPIVPPATRFTGLDVQSVIRIDPEAFFRIIVDEHSGDQLEVEGEATLSFYIEPSGRMSLSGNYILRRGFYEMRMYDIARRRFELLPGSQLTWSGDPSDAALDLRASYRVRTSPLDLMSDQLAGVDAGIRTQYRQEYPFDALLHIGGTLMAPEFTFQLDMPQQARHALGGNVYNRIQQINTMPSELNTQVFSLVILGRFLPQDISSEGAGRFDASTMARTSASRMLSGQLNALSERYVRGVDLDLDLESFIDYQSGRPEERTQLNLRLRRSLFHERLTVQIGGQIDIEGGQETEQHSALALFGDMSIEYRLSKDGRWGIRGFRRNQFEGLIEGQVIANGISLLFNRDFNHFAELFRSPKKQSSANKVTGQNNSGQ